MADKIKNPKIKREEEKDEGIETGLPFKVMLFNDDWHSFDEVIIQIIKAVKCSFDEARSYAFEAHVNGKTVIFQGELSKCLKVTSVLDEIALHSQIVS